VTVEKNTGNLSMPQTLIELHDLDYAISDLSTPLHLLKKANLRLQAGESLAIVGPSGAGKSTLLALMAGLLQSTGGEIHLFGQALSGMDEDARAALRAKQVGFVFQDFQLMPAMSALENVMMPIELFDLGDAKSKAVALLTQFGLGERLNHLPSQLSGGEQQRVAIARALAIQPKILFADEPTGNLDETTGAAIQTYLIEQTRAQQTALVLVTHDPDFAKACDRQVHLSQGQLSEITLAESQP
jgi:putative ABC transport system ATP-binding protein